MARGRPQMDIALGAELREAGLSWREVGIELARLEGRSMPYQPASVATTVSGQRVKREMARLIGRGPYDD